jgi:hypothetical protein
MNPYGIGHVSPTAGCLNWVTASLLQSAVALLSACVGILQCVYYASRASTISAHVCHSGVCCDCSAKQYQQHVLPLVGAVLVQVQKVEVPLAVPHGALHFQEQERVCMLRDLGGPRASRRHVYTPAIHRTCAYDTQCIGASRATASDQAVAKTRPYITLHHAEAPSHAAH